MRVKYDSTWIADDGFLTGGLLFDGSQVAEEVGFLRALYSSQFERANRTHSVSFQVERTFDTMLEAEQFIFSHYASLPNRGTLIFRIGLDSEGTQDASAEGAVLLKISHQQTGISVRLTYQFKFARITGIIASPEDDEFESGSTPIGNASSSVSVTGLGLAAIPAVVLVTVRKPAGGFNLVGTVDADSISTDGFDCYFNGQTDSGDYALDWLVILP